MILRDHNAFAGSQPISLENYGPSKFSRADHAQSIIDRFRSVEAGRRHAVTCHERLGKGLARLEPRGCGGGTEDEPTGGGKTIRNAKAERQLGADDREIDLLPIGEIDQRVKLG